MALHSSKTASWDLRPFSEYFYEQAMGRKDFKFLFYCRNCIKNFDAPVRVDRCKFCGQDRIVELPKFVWKRRQIVRKAVTPESIKGMIAKLSQKMGHQEGLDFATRLRLAMIYYFDIPKLSVEPDYRAEEASQVDLARSFEIV